MTEKDEGHVLHVRNKRPNKSDKNVRTRGVDEQFHTYIDTLLEGKFGIN